MENSEKSLAKAQLIIALLLATDGKFLSQRKQQHFAMK